MSEEIKKLAENLQKEAHEYTNGVMKRNPEIDYQSVLNAWFYLKLAEIITNKENKTRTFRR
jgi:hypothetical protein